MSEVEDLIESARSEIEAGRRSLATSYLSDACGLARSDFDWEQIGCLYTKINEDESALRCLRRASRLAPRDDAERRAHLAELRGRCLRKLCLYERAEQAYLSSIELAPSASRYVSLGRLQRSHGYLADAEKTLAQAVAIYPEDEQVLFHYGFVVAEDHPRKAVRVLMRLVSLFPGSGEGHSELGYAMIWDGRLADAECTLHRAVGLGGHWIWPYLYLDICLGNQERPFSERYANLMRADEVYSSFLVALLLGDLFLEWGRNEDALKCYEDYLAGKWALADRSYSMEDLQRGDIGFLELQRWRLVAG